MLYVAMCVCLACCVSPLLLSYNPVKNDATVYKSLASCHTICYQDAEAAFPDSTLTFSQDKQIQHVFYSV